MDEDGAATGGPRRPTRAFLDVGAVDEEDGDGPKRDMLEGSIPPSAPASSPGAWRGWASGCREGEDGLHCGRGRAPEERGGEGAKRESPLTVAPAASAEGLLAGSEVLATWDQSSVKEARSGRWNRSVMSRNRLSVSGRKSGVDGDPNKDPPPSPEGKSSSWERSSGVSASSASGTAGASPAPNKRTAIDDEAGAATPAKGDSGRSAELDGTPGVTRVESAENVEPGAVSGSPGCTGSVELTDAGVGNVPLDSRAPSRATASRADDASGPRAPSPPSAESSGTGGPRVSAMGKERAKVARVWFRPHFGVALRPATLGSLAQQPGRVESATRSTR